MTVPVPRVAAPSLNVTVPLGAAAPVPPVTVAVNVKLEPTTAELAEAVRAVVLAIDVIVTTTEVEADERLRESPP